MMEKKMIDLFLIVISIIISWNISMSSDLTSLELGALVNLVYPFLGGIFSIAIYLLGTWVLSQKAARVVFLLLAIIMNLGIGILIRFADF